MYLKITSYKSIIYSKTLEGNLNQNSQVELTEIAFSIDALMYGPKVALLDFIRLVPSHTDMSEGV